MSITILRRWEASGRLACEHTAGGHCRYNLAKHYTHLQLPILVNIIEKHLDDFLAYSKALLLSEPRHDTSGANR